MAEISLSQKKLIEIVKKVGRRGPDKILVGPELTDVFGRQLKLVGQAMDPSGTQLSQKTLDLIEELQKPDSESEKILSGQVMWYDVRSSVWQENPELSALFAMAYAQVLIERTGKKTGHTVNIAVDCYKKHFESMSVFVDTIIRTGIVQDGGGVFYWGVQNGGSIRNIAQYERAITQENGNWIFGTMSHRAEDYIGAKFGMLGKVFCGPDLREDLYSKLIKADFPAIVKIDDPNDFIVTVGDLTENNADILEDLIRARTGTKLPASELLSGLRVGMNMCGSPVGKNLLDILKAFGADVVADNDKLNENYSTSNIVDPNEHDSEPMESMKRKAKDEDRICLAVDPDGDRGTVIALNSSGEAESLAGTELLILAAENLVSYNPDDLGNDVIFDMRTGVSIALLKEQLKKKEKDLNIIAAEPGYPFFMELMGKNKDAVIAVENTAHEFITPMTNPIWGAPRYYEGVQGGDDAAIFLVYLLALSKILWDGRNPVEQLEFIRKEYGLPKTMIREFKPKIDKKDAARKYDLAEAMCNIAEGELGPTGNFGIVTMNSGVRLTASDQRSMVLIRYSNTGPSFTASGEAVEVEESERMFKLGGAIMNKAVEKVIKEKGEFVFDWANFAEYGNISSEDAQKIIDEAK